jgi:hypothetical protein
VPVQIRYKQPATSLRVSRPILTFTSLSPICGGVLNWGNPNEACQYNSEAVRCPDDALSPSQLGLTYLMLNRGLRKELRRAADQLDDFLYHHPDWPNTSPTPPGQGKAFGRRCQ